MPLDGGRILLSDVSEIRFSFPERKGKDDSDVTLFASATSFRENNIVSDLKKEADLVPDERCSPHAGDIIIRRVQPTFVNYIDADAPYYLGQNLIIIRPRPELIFGKYLAFVIENKIERLHGDTAGSLIPSLKRKDLECFDVGDPPPLRKKNAIGELWWLNKEKAKLQAQLTDTQTKYIKSMLSKMVEERK